MRMAHSHRRIRGGREDEEATKARIGSLSPPPLSFFLSFFPSQEMEMVEFLSGGITVVVAEMSLVAEGKKELKKEEKSEGRGEIIRRRLSAPTWPG